MKMIFAILVIVVFVAPAAAFDLGNSAPAKPVSQTIPSPPDPEILRQGGDTIADAVRIPIPTMDLAGTTTGYTDDYDETCPMPGDAPDVVYSIVPDVDQLLTIDMCGSQYDTKIWVYDESMMGFIACNDDFYGSGDPCGDYVSKIEHMVVEAGHEYWIIVDGYASEHGDYLIDVYAEEPCLVDCPAGADLEGEPPLMDGYVDIHNGGCNTDLVAPPLQPITSPVFCGVSGWYLLDGANFRDTDWFLVDVPATGVLEITGDAEFQCSMFELGPQECDNVVVLQSVIIGPCAEASMTIIGEPGSAVWFWVGPTMFENPHGFDDNEFNYVLMTNVDVVATENHSWTDVKALFD